MSSKGVKGYFTLTEPPLQDVILLQALSKEVGGPSGGREKNEEEGRRKKKEKSQLFLNNSSRSQYFGL